MKKNITNLFVKINDKGFMISTLIYGIFIMFIVILSALMVTLNYRKNAFSNITMPEGSGTPGTKTEEEGDDVLYKDEDLNGTDPVLGGLTPVMYFEQASSKTGYWKVVSPEDKWYDYDEQWWANAVSLKTKDKKEGDVLDLNNDVYAMFVWIPKYSYSINCSNKTSEGVCLASGGTSASSPGAIDIKFGKDNYNNTPEYSGSSPAESNYYTHPAFTFGTEELTGIWVGKFQTTGDTTTPTILPDALSIKEKTVYDEFYAAQEFTSPDNIYGLTGDAHMMKNSEWAAVAYLSQSKYGKYSNDSRFSHNYSLAFSGKYKEVFFNDSNSYTGRSSAGPYSTQSYVSSYCPSFSEKGCFRYNGIGALLGTNSYNYLYGTGASTTGNVYGVYDMNGGLEDRLMAFYGSDTLSSVGLEGIEDKYYDYFSIELPYKYNLDYKGHATYEVSRTANNDGWYYDRFNWFKWSSSKDDVWVTRGGYYYDSNDDKGYISGIFNFTPRNGEASTSSTFRVSFVAR